MNVVGFRKWLEANYSASTVSTKLSEGRKIAKAYGDLDAHYDTDQLRSIGETFDYSAKDQRDGKPNPSKLALSSDINRDLSQLRTTLNYYRSYRDGASITRPDRDAVLEAMQEHDTLGQEAFLSAYGFSPRFAYWVMNDAKRYPSKAIFGVAHQYMPGGMPLDTAGCNGTDAWNHLKRLGFEIVKTNDGTEDDDDTETRRQVSGVSLPPTNLILYGPPGTGKTFNTIAQAVRLCDRLDEADPLLVAEDRREELKTRYDELVVARRIDFVTFHQSYSYEEFVEGLRPAQGSDNETGSGGTVGFSLVPEDGIFRRIAQRAAASKGGQGRYTLDKRNVFKLSIGAAARAEDDYLFEEAISEGYAFLGYDDIDWSDARFEHRDAIIEACEAYDQAHPHSERRHPTAQAGRVQCPLIFRNRMTQGDLVVVSKGNSLFRAIGEVSGKYEYAPRESGLYSHRRKVNWLWIEKTGVPVDDIYSAEIKMQTVYQLAPGNVNTAALESYINGQLPGSGTSTPDPYVLIIDEINRGNISKIFGELITLIEPDKRVGEANALEVRLPYSKLPFSVPANLHIVGTMNTADRSIARLDTALRRRFEFRELPPKPSRLPVDLDGIPLRQVLETMNDRIEYLVDREHRIGHAFFLNCRDRGDIDAAMRNKVIPLLQEYFFEDWARVAAVLGERPGKGGAFLDCRKLSDPTGGDGGDRDSWRVREAFAVEAYTQLIGKPRPESGQQA